MEGAWLVFQAIKGCGINGGVREREREQVKILFSAVMPHKVNLLKDGRGENAGAITNKKKKIPVWPHLDFVRLTENEAVEFRK